jgi:hypothetical protein
LFHDDCAFGFETGSYEISGRYLGTYELEAVTVTVRKPTDEEKQAIAALLDFQRRPWGKLDYYLDYAELYEEYAHTELGLRIGRGLVGQGIIGNAPKDLELHYAIDFIQRFPYHTYARSAFKRAFKLLSDEELRDTLSSARGLFDNSYARQMFKTVARELGKEHLIEAVLEE